MDCDIYPPSLFFVVFCYLLQFLVLVFTYKFLCSSVPSTSSPTCSYPLLHYSVRCIPATQVVCFYLATALGYDFLSPIVLFYIIRLLIKYLLPFAPLCTYDSSAVSRYHNRIYSNMDRLYPATLIRGQLKCDGTSAETRFRHSAKRTSPFKLARGREVSSVDYWQPRCAHQP